ncbi:MAG: ATPase [Haliscomenobacteraceae bacterium CHB4]|nr:ATPase [Haliscomenobacteraceae bacterium CHB4]
MTTLANVVGRKKEIMDLQSIVESPRSEFLAVYGRRRVGKTFLLREFFEYRFDFQISGLANAGTAQQLFNFHTALARQSSLHFDAQPENWLVAFQRLMDHLETLESGGKKIVFFDEMPWFDTKGSDFVMGLEHFWNSWASNRKDVLLITCGSAASWMMNVLINHPGGLHNRVTQKMKIEPFCLREVEEMLARKGGVLERYQIVQLYMALGGIPYYLEAVKPDLSATQNIQALFFDKAAFLKNEFFNLYRSLFKKHELYEKVVEVLSTRTYGLRRTEIVQLSRITSGGTLSKVLADLEESGFITSYISLDEKSKNTLYRLSDYYTAFYFRFIKDSPYRGEGAWINLMDNPVHRAWQGFTFEQVCLDHIPQIKKALGIQGVLSKEATWKGGTETQSAQIDLLIDRRDQVINLCEAKFSLGKFAIDKSGAEQLRNKINVFKTVSKTKKAVFLTMITTHGLEKNQYAAALVQNEVTLEDLFA